MILVTEIKAKANALFVAAQFLKIATVFCRLTGVNIEIIGTTENGNRNLLANNK